MAIGLPPPQTPQQGDLDTLREEASHGFSFAYNVYQIHVSGNDKISNAELKRRFKSAGNVSDAVRLIPALYYRAGYPLTQVLYALSGTDLYIHISVRGVDRVRAAAPIAGYFSGLADGAPLTDTRLEPRRVLATVAAERAGMSSDLRIDNDGSSAHPDYVLKAPGDDDAQGTVHGTLDYGNIGNRYVGRDIADATLTATTPYGDRFNFGAISSVQGFGIGDPGGFYREINGAYDRDTPYGIFSIDGRYAPFRQTVSGFQFQEAIQQAGVSWLFPVYADFTRRLVFQFHALRSSLAANLAQLPQFDVKSELYTAVEGGLTYQQTLGSSGHWRFGGGLLVSHGLGPHHAALTASQLDYLLYRPSLSLTYDPGTPWTVALNLRGQYSNDTVPETQQWVLGGLGQLSAYRAGVFIGDTGALGSVTVSYRDIPLWIARLTPSTYAEYGYSRQANALPGQVRQTTQQLGDVGGSLLLKLGDHAAATASIAESVYDHNISADVRHSFRATYFFRLSLTF